VCAGHPQSNQQTKEMERGQWKGLSGERWRRRGREAGIYLLRVTQDNCTEGGERERERERTSISTDYGAAIITENGGGRS
jgi:hypothetical protein